MVIFFYDFVGDRGVSDLPTISRDGEHSQYSNAHRAIIYVQIYTTPGANPVGLIIRKGYMRSNQNISKDI